jgi:hypothetical protein
MKILLKSFLICSLVAQTHAFTDTLTDTLYNLLDVTDFERKCFENGNYHTAIRTYLSLNQDLGQEYFSQGIWHGGVAGGLIASQLGKFETNTERLQNLGTGVGTGLVGACITHFIIRCTPLLLGFTFLNASMPDKEMRRAYWSGFLASAIVSSITTKLAQYVHKMLKNKDRDQITNETHIY